MKTKLPPLSRMLLSVLIGSLGMPAQSFAAPLSLAMAPAGNGYKPPAPNVLVSIDDSASMRPPDRENLKAALRQTFSAASIPDHQIRLAWQTMTGCRGIPNAGASCKGLNGMKSLAGTHRQNFLDWAATFDTIGGTPSHLTMKAAGDYFKTPSSELGSPWASKPGETLNPVLSCRRAFHIFMTDGEWFSEDGWKLGDHVAVDGGNPDGTSRTLPDGKVYDVSDDATRVYRDDIGSLTHDDGRGSFFPLSTFSDLAFHYWATDLQPALDNNVPQQIVRKGSEVFTADSKSFSLPEYWNPRNDPATWQHLTTYTVGYGDAMKFNESRGFTSYPNLKPDWDFSTNDTFGGDFPLLVTGDAIWRDPIYGTAETDYIDVGDVRKRELWHAAINSRGRYLPATDASTLAKAFQDILKEVVKDSSAPLTSIGLNVQQLRRDSTAFVSGYDASTWSGFIEARTIVAASGATGSGTPWGTTLVDGKPVPVTTATQLAVTAPENRKILTASDVTGGGIDFTWDALSAPQKAMLGTTTLGTTTDALGEQRLNFIRGSRTNESASGAARFRSRASVQGDTVNSQLWHVGAPTAAYRKNNYATYRTGLANRTPMVYVGANDGMLHAFKANVDDPKTTVDEGAGGGTELFAYIPRGLLPELSQLTRADYVHRPYVDGSPFTGDLYVGDSWKTYLAGTTGAGSKGYFVLDVTDPSTFATATAASLVVLDTTSTTDPDVGHITANPVLDLADKRRAQQITQLNDGRWALVMGNGYNSSSEDAVLLIQYLDGARELKKIAATAVPGGQSGNGLAAPRLIDLNGDDAPDVAYAGDLLGNLWKFDLSSKKASGWKTETFGGSTPTPLFVAVASTGGRQPITGAPVWRPHPQGGLMLAFGTGRNLTVSDRSDTAQQTLYGVRDSALVTLDPILVAGKPTATTVTLSGGAAISDGRTSLVEQTVTESSPGSGYYQLSSNAVAYGGASPKKGWFIDLATSGSRVVTDGELFDGNLIELRSMRPALSADMQVEACEGTQPASVHWSNIVNIVTGGAPSFGIYDVSGDGTFANTASVTTTPENATSVRNGANDAKLIIGTDRKSLNQRLGPRTPVNASWRQLQ